MSDAENVKPVTDLPPQQAAQGTQIQIGGGLIPLPNGTFIGQIWFSNLPNEMTARQFMAQVDEAVKKMFVPQPAPPQQTNGPVPPTTGSGVK